MKNRFLGVITAMALTAGSVPFAVFAVDEHENQVHVIVENTTFTPDSEYWDDNFWYGTLVDTWVDLNEDSTMMTCIVEAIESVGGTQVGAESNYISYINDMGEFDGGFMSGWMGTLNDWFTNEGFGAFTVAEGELETGDEIRVMYTCAYGDDLGGSWSNSDSTIKNIEFSAGTLSPAFDKDVTDYVLTVPSDVKNIVITPTATNKNYQVRTKVDGTEYKRTKAVPVSNGSSIVVECNYEGSLSMNTNGVTSAYNITVMQEAPVVAEAQDVSEILSGVLEQLATDIPEPGFGTSAGEWSVLCLARGEYFDKDNAYFKDYYDRIVEAVNSNASSTNMNGALHKVKSTENSRLIVALSSLGINAESVGDWNLITPYDDFNWIKKQGINGPVWALIALDTNDYQTTDSTIRQQCIDYLISKQTPDGGWALSGSTADPDMTAMTIQALARYTDDSNVKAAVDKGIEALSAIQKENGGYDSWGSINSESIAQVIVACTTMGINPDTDERFIKNGYSAVDALLTFYNSENRTFSHIAGDGGNGMATDQATYALVAYDRFMNGKTALYDMSDVDFGDTTEPVKPVEQLTATLGLPQEISSKQGTEFNAVVNIDGWDNSANYKLMDCIVDVPDGLTVTSVTMGDRVSGGQVMWNLEESTGKLRIVYFDPEKNQSINISGTEFPAEFFIIGFKSTEKLTADELDIGVSGMSMKFSSDSASDVAIEVVDTEKASGTVKVVDEISFSACVLYQGDGIDLIPEDKMAVCVAVANLDENSALSFSDGTLSYDFMYSEAITNKTGIMSYVALVDSSAKLINFTEADYFTLGTKPGDELVFGDSNGDGVINAQDALNSVNKWLRKTDAPTDTEILRLNVNSDSRINTFDALGIVEYFVHGNEFIIVNKAATAYNSAE
ncbi:MAG: cadherin-like beta sandwich domain-containing protein [Ruminococcus flavefaciens]|nr:cadherin-like beta sandwich domain-containing protein [Ruminococcus flavefaciens]MCM1230839.1 cadherin-like beta sandwich domain-containing protein [Ruminococcus flavefaciens]